MDKIGIISTVRAPLSQLKMFVNYHLNLGIDKIILFFDDPKDEGIDFYSDNKKIITIPCSDLYWSKISSTKTKPETVVQRQIANLNHIGLQILKGENCKWVIHIDCDELLRPLDNIKTILKRSKEDVLVFDLLEAYPTKENYSNIFSPTIFKRLSSNKKINIAKLLLCSNAIYNDEYFRGHTRSKTAVRISPKVKRYKIHRHKGHERLIVRHTKDIQLLHYDCVGINDWKVKWDRRIDGTGKSTTIRKNRKQQLNEYINAKEKNTLSSLYKRMHRLRKSEYLQLFSLRMITQVKLNKELFKNT
ncbi:glycosyltransferase family 2 protein [Amphritea balenae]|uniref:Glycosyltransferase family 2 protein n=1 Tax=Amphritea balenae TaxID=452629 RepID=A0A3P1SMH0_9GAMM|nr:glycosyltransferase family 2 protein [Amphritea balenae]RRC98317.1 hypothetical protein EHS89_14600 [Amphritea balenae]GGK80891.1 hypothetical protein GCM10007941_34150 [Amphritea balenae]